MKKKYFGIVLMALCISIMACSSSKLNGAWVPEGRSSAPFSFPDNIEFFSDGTCEIEGYNGEYTVDNGRLKIVLNVGAEIAYTYDYELKNDTLILTREEESIQYVRNK